MKIVHTLACAALLAAAGCGDEMEPAPPNVALESSSSSAADAAPRALSRTTASDERSDWSDVERAPETVPMSIANYDR